MELNLKKARKLEAQIQAHLDDELSVETVASIRVLSSMDEVKKAILDVKAKATMTLLERSNLINLRYKIRRQIEVLNEKSGINELINDKVRVTKLLSDLKSVNFNESLSEQELSDQKDLHTKILTAGESSGLRGGIAKTSFNTNVFTKSDIDDFEKVKFNYKKELETIEDDINYKNMTNNVVLTEDDVKTLQSYRLI